jgi:hypothetical protein
LLDACTPNLNLVPDGVFELVTHVVPLQGVRNKGACNSSGTWWKPKRQGGSCEIPRRTQAALQCHWRRPAQRTSAGPGRKSSQSERLRTRLSTVHSCSPTCHRHRVGAGELGPQKPSDILAL